jgi:hypothetical protein
MTEYYNGDVIAEIREIKADMDELVAWILKNPEIEGSYYSNSFNIQTSIFDENEGNWRSLTAPEIAVRVRALSKDQPIGSVKKDAYGNAMTYKLWMPNNRVSIELCVMRETVCVQKVVGQETVEEKDYSQIPTRTVTRDIVEWECIPLLAQAES